MTTATQKEQAGRELHVREYDIVVAGGGISGMCAAIAAARLGRTVALVQNRPVLGGNNSSEIRMHVCGADLMGRRPDSRETGIIEEIQEEHKARNPGNSWAIYDAILWEKAHFQDNLDLYLNTHVCGVVGAQGSIVAVRAEQLTSELQLQFRAPLFVDATGDGTVGALAGAEYLSGREGRDMFGEQFAPEHGDGYTMGNTLMFKATDTGKPVAFSKPAWANTYSEDDLRMRDHSGITGGYWWIELGGMELDTIRDAEAIRDELLKAVYGVWDHIKNGGDHGADTYDLEWVQFLPGKRESRRLVGDYVLTEKDIMQSTHHPDAVAYGGWSIDLHAMGGLRNSDETPATQHLKKYTPEKVFTIPYRCLYSKNIENLFIAGRAFSVSHVAFGATRQIATCAVAGQAVGTAAALCLEKQVSPRGLLERVGELQQSLLRQDCFIPGVSNEDPADLARGATITCSSSTQGAEGALVINGNARRIGSDGNCWVSEEPAEGQWLQLDLRREAALRCVQLTFDPNLNSELKISLSKGTLSRQRTGTPPELVKDYDLELLCGGAVVQTVEVRDNHLRHRVHNLHTPVTCDSVRVTVRATQGDAHARIFEIRAYE